MKLNKLQINGYGSIEDRIIELDDGINLIFGENESGKSTLASFIKSMFYGVNRNKAGNEFSEFEMTKPWKHIDFSGKIEYEVDDKFYTAFRDFNRNNSKVYDESGTEITSEFNKDKSRGLEIGIKHIGVDEETFLNTLYVPQNSSLVDISSQKNIIQKLTNIIQSGQEGVSLEKIRSKLQKRILDEIGTDRTHNKPINSINKEIIEKEQIRAKLLSNRERKEELDDISKEIDEQIKKVDSDILEAKKVLELKEKYVSLLEEKERTYELTLKIKEKEREEKLETSKIQYRNALILLILVTLIASVALFYFKYYNWIIVEITLAAIALVSLNTSNKINITEVNTMDFAIWKEELNKKETKELEKLRQKGIKSTFIDRKVQELKNVITGFENKKNDLILETHKIKLEEGTLKENIARLTDLEEQLAELKEKKDELLLKAKILNLAIAKLDESYDELKLEVIPDMEKNIKSMIYETTNGKYVKVIYNNTEGILIENAYGEIVPISKLSVGTIDQMYLGFRLGLAKKIGDMPIILDESFAFYDDERLKNILNALKNVKKQVIILSCSNREKEIMDELGIKYNYLTM